MFKPLSNSCSCSAGCCESQKSNKKVEIDFLYLDLTVCERCQGTLSNLDEAVKELAPILEAAGYTVIVNKVNIASPELAVTYEFVSSPTIRVNGRDIQLEVRETICEECGDLCGTDTECRSWLYEGEEYSEPPKAMIIESVLKEVFGNQGKPAAKEPYELPENLASFFEGVDTGGQKATLPEEQGELPAVAFVCVHNSCRSQMAEAIAKVLAADVFAAYSAGTETKPRINRDAVDVIKELYNVDMNSTQHSKLLQELPPIDILITMGCNVECPYLPCRHREDWGIADSTGKGKEVFLETAGLIREKVLALKERIAAGEL